MPWGPEASPIARAFRETPPGCWQFGVPAENTPPAHPILRLSRKGSTSWPPQGSVAGGSDCQGSWPALARRRLWVGSSVVMAMARVLHDVLQSGICWRVTLHACPDQGSLVRFEKSGKGGRLLHQESSQWNRLAGGFLFPRERVAGGMVPKYLVERIEAILRGSPLPARRSEREQVRGMLVRAR